ERVPPETPRRFSPEARLPSQARPYHHGVRGKRQRLLVDRPALSISDQMRGKPECMAPPQMRVVPPEGRAPLRALTPQAVTDIERPRSLHVRGVDLIECVSRFGIGPADALIHPLRTVEEDFRAVARDPLEVVAGNLHDL